MVSIRPKTIVTTTVRAVGTSHARSDITVRDVSSIIDEPEERGGSNTGPSPTETTLAGLAGCTNVIAHKCAKALGIDIGHLDITVAARFDRRGVTLTEEINLPFPEIDVTVMADGPVSDADLQRVAEQVGKFCPVSKLFKAAGTKITETWKSNSHQS